MSRYFVGAEVSWEDYLRESSLNGDITREIRSSSQAERRAIARQTQEIVASRRAIVRKFGSGFYTVKNTLERGFVSVEQAIRDTQGAIEDLKSSFDYHIALVLDQMRLQNQSLTRMLDKLDAIHSTLENPLLTQARELFRIGSERMLDGLYDKALEAFLQSLQKEETNFITQLMVGKLYLYGVNSECSVIDLQKAEQHLRAAARYARAASNRLPDSRRYAGEALLHAGIACYAQINRQLSEGEGKQAQKLIKQAYDLVSEACAIYPELSEGHYQRAKFAALIGDGKTSMKSLEKAIEIDEGYCLKAQEDQDFRDMRSEIDGLLEKLRKKNEYKIKDKLAKCVSYITDWHYPTLEAKNAKHEIKVILQEVKNLLAKKTFFDNRQALHLLQEVEYIFQSLLVHRFALHTLSAHHGRVTSLAFNPGQTCLASGGADKTINLWRLPENQQTAVLRGHGDSITRLCFSHDGRALVSVDRVGGIRLWNIETGAMLQEFVGHGSPVHCLAFRPDDSVLAIGFYDRKVRLWSMEDYSLLHTLSGHNSSVDTLVFSPDGKFLATGSPDNTAALWHVDLGELVQTFHGCSGLTNSLIFKQDGKILITGSNDGGVKFYDSQSGELTHELPPRAGAISWLCLSPDGKLLATINFGKTLQLWDVESGKLLHNLKPFSPGISSVRFSPDGTMLAASDYQDRSVKLWSVQEGKLMHVIAGSLTCSEFSPDGTYFVTGDESGSLKFWGRTIKRQHEKEPIRAPISAEKIWKTGAPLNGQTQMPSATPASTPEETREIDTAEVARPTVHPQPGPVVEADAAPGQGKVEAVAAKAAEATKPQKTEAAAASPQTQAEEIEIVVEPEDTNGYDEQKIIEERMQKGLCYICGKPIGVIARLAGIKLCYKHSFTT